MKRIFVFFVCVALMFYALDMHWYPTATAAFGGCLVVGAPTSMLRKQRSNRTTKPGVNSAREKAA